MLTLITPTGDRPEAFKLCERWIANQYYTGDYRWIVVDDGVEPTQTTNKNIEYIRLPPATYNTQKRNLLEGLSRVSTNDKLVHIEDDDYYNPNWLGIMDVYLDKFDLVGETNTIYYNIRTLKYLENKNNTHSSLCSTGMTGEAIKHFYSVCRCNDLMIDIRMWRSFTGSKHLLNSNNVIGMKGLPGRLGIGAGHKPGFLKQEDMDGKVLKNLIGRDAEAYL